MSACPTCGKDVDALRARNVKVRAGKVVAYCSPECLASAESMPNVVPARTGTPAQGVVKAAVAPDSGPVIEIRYEPASGVVTSAKDERSPTPTPKPIEKKKAENKVGDNKADDKKVDKKVDSKVDDKKADKKADDKAKKPGEKRPVLKIIEEAGGAPRDIKPAKGGMLANEPAQLSAAKLGDVAAVIDPGKRRLSRETLKRDNRNVDQSEDWLDDEPAKFGAVRAGTDVEEEPARSGGKRALILLVVLALLAAAGVLAYKLLGRGTTSKLEGSVGMRPSGSQAERPPDPAAVPAPPPPTNEQIKTRAIGVLRRWLDSKDSARVQRVAAAALSRTRDQAAIDRLVVALQRDKLEEAGRLEVAYALARAGDKRGLDAIAGALAAPRRDDKLIAGRLLVQLGDTRAVNTLAQYLEVPQHKLGTAEWLARLGDPRALKVLEQIRADAAAQPDDKARAVIALAYAGKSGLSEELRGLLADPRFNVFAAEALAQHRDETARPVLVKLLEVSSLRVGAARALRTLSPDGDQTTYAKSLLVMLDDPGKQRDTEQIPVAEAILLLLGPVGWAERT
ncbi:MAG: HEAT repeat domain-containing protein [Deltaproteobacteria bacterium]|nr:HEAT repeat domain-containing protein [Deltaproteobacteria bacterium]